MSFLLDTDICSAYMKSNHAVTMRFIQYGGRLHISAVTLGKLWTRVDRANAPARRLQTLLGLLKEVRVVPVAEDVARKFGEVRAWQLDNGLRSPDLDFINGVTALAHGLTLVTHNLQDYANIPGLTVVDWMVP